MSILEQLKGTSWDLVEYRSESISGDLLYPLGADALGTIIFTTEGYTAVQIMAKNREDNISPENLEQYNTEVEKDMARFGYHAYTGPFTFDEETNVLTTHVTISLIPEYIGTQQARKVIIEGDILKLSNILHPERKIVWKRIDQPL